MYISFDINHDMTIGEFTEILEKHSLTCSVIEARGPAGGNPFIRVHGEYDNLEAFQREANLDDGIHPITGE